MPYTTNWEKNGIYWQLSGVVTSEEIFNFTNSFYQDPKSDTIKYQIVDCLNIIKFELSDNTMKEVAALDYAASLSIHNIKVALLINDSDSKTINQTYINYLHTFNSDWVVKIFDNLNDARQWVSA